MGINKEDKYAISVLYRQNFEALAAMGFDKQKMYEEAGINFDVFAPDERISCKHSEAVWKTLTKYIPEDHISFKIMERFSMASLGIAGYVVVHSANSIKAFENFSRYAMLHSNCYNFSVKNSEDIEIHIERTVDYEWSDRFMIEMNVIGFTKHVLELLHNKIYPKAVFLEFDAPKDMSAYQALFSTNTTLVFNADNNKIVYDASIADMPLINANSQLYQLFDKIAEESLQQIQEQDSVSHKVRKELVHRIKGYLPPLEEIASQLNMSGRNLQIKLKKENTSYRDLSDEVRKDIALSHIRKRTLNISEIAYLLGFSEVSSFSSSFKKWTGMTPSSYVN